MDGSASGPGRARGEGRGEGLITGPRRAQLIRGARVALGRPLTAEELSSLERYLALIATWSRVHRLTGSTEPGWLIEHVILDSLLFARALGRVPETLLDIGPGAGAPGLPLKIVWRGLSLTAIEARRRRASFLTTAVRELGLSGVTVLNCRAEALVDELGGRYDAVVFRAVGPLERVVPLAVRFARPGGVVIGGGPPIPRLAPLGRWVEVPSLGPGRTRRFLRVDVPG